MFHVEHFANEIGNKVIPNEYRNGKGIDTKRRSGYNI